MPVVLHAKMRGYPCFGLPERPWVVKIARVETAPGLIAWSPLQRAKSRCCPKHDTAVTLELLQRKGALQKDLKKAEVSFIRTGGEKAVPGASFLLCWWLLQPLRRGRNTSIPSIRQGCWLVGRSPFREPGRQCGSSSLAGGEGAQPHTSCVSGGPRSYQLGAITRNTGSWRGERCIMPCLGGRWRATLGVN